MHRFRRFRFRLSLLLLLAMATAIGGLPARAVAACGGGLASGAGSHRACPPAMARCEASGRTACGCCGARAAAGSATARLRRAASCGCVLDAPAAPAAPARTELLAARPDLALPGAAAVRLPAPERLLWGAVSPSTGPPRSRHCGSLASRAPPLSHAYRV